MSAHIYATGTLVSKQVRKQNRLRRRPTQFCEALEGRVMMARIEWMNRGNDNFDAIYGAKAFAARQIVDVAIQDWSFAIQNFNYSDTSHDNRYELFVSASNIGGAFGVTGALSIDKQGKPFSAGITLDDNPNFFIPEKWLGPGAYTSLGDFEGEYSTSPTFRQPNDFYTTVLHEIGHAVGIALDNGLRIHNFLTPAGGTLLNFNAGSTTAQMTTDGGGHIVGVSDLMNTFQQDRRRKRITPLDIAVLRDAYGYTVVEPTTALPKLGELPSYFGTFCTYYNLSLPPGEGCVIQEVGVPPQLDPIDDVMVTEGSIVSLQAQARDENPGEIFVFSLDPGAPAGATIHPNTGEITFTASDGPAVHTFTVRVNDNGCGCAADTFSDSETFTVTVGNLPPTAGVSGPALGVRGQPIAFNLTASDPSTVDEAAGFTYLVDFNDGTAAQTVSASANNGAGLLLDHAFATSGTYNVSVTATDKDGAPSSPAATHAITIASSAVLPDPGNPGAFAFVLGGTSGGDEVDVSSKGIKLNGVTTPIPPGVARLIIYGQDGNDDIHLNGNFDMPVLIDGGRGNDAIKGGRGNDILLGGPGDDDLLGHHGRDLLIGGPGADHLNGQQDDDILIGGSTTHDGNAVSLSMIMAEWSRPGLSAADRITHLRLGGAGALNGLILLDALSLIDDGLADELNGGPGSNLVLM